jgi:hypothetical protein
VIFVLNVIKLLCVTNRRSGSVALVSAISGASWLETLSATLGEEPEIEMACVIVPVCTESRLRFRATLGEEPEVEVALV